MKTLSGLMFGWVVAVMVIAAVMDVEADPDKECYDPEDCTELQYCDDADTSSGTCQDLVADGASCFQDIECMSKKCNANDNKKERPQLEEGVCAKPCDPRCTEKEYCEYKLSPAVCLTKLANGDKCFANIECMSNECNFIDEGEERECTKKMEPKCFPPCPNGKFCDDKNGDDTGCSDLKTDGSCTDDFECASKECVKPEGATATEEGSCAKTGEEEKNRGNKRRFPKILRYLKIALEKVKAKYNGRY